MSTASTADLLVLRRRVCDLLAELGSSPDAVARRLHATGFAGVRNDCRRCPLARYLATELAPAVSVRVCATNVVLDVSAAGNLDEITVTLPRPVEVFIVRFDLTDRYRQLQDAT